MGNETKKTVSRSTSYPSMALNDALVRLSRLKDSMGLSGGMNRETVANGIGYSTLTGTSARAVAAMTNYGLLSRSKDKYSISELGKRYLLPTKDDDVANARRQAALSPKLFNQIYQDFKGQILPKLIANILADRYGVQDKVSGDVIKIFKATMLQAGLMSEAGILQDVAVSESSKEPETPPDASSETTEGRGEGETRMAVVERREDPQISGDTLNEQDVSHSGSGWTLRVVVRTSHRLDRESRKEIRKFINAADELADRLDELDESTNHE